MDLTLFVPDMDEESMTLVETRPAKVERWLAELPLLNLAETSHQIYRSLAALNRMELDDKTRLKLLEIYREPVARICTELKQEYIGLPLPLPDKGRIAAERARGFQIEMAHGYKRLVMNALRAMRSKPSSRALSSLGLIIQRAIRYLGETLVKSYQFYAARPENTWREIHQLYELAETYGANDASVPDPLNMAIAESSVSHAYKQALLLDLSDPYHQPVRMIDMVQHYLNRWASMAKLRPAAAVPSDACRFLIDQRTDRAGEVSTGKTESKLPSHYRLLDNIELARVIHSQLGILQKGQLPDPEGLHADFYISEHAKDILLHLINAWGVNPKRAYQRTRGQGNQLDVAIGIRAINFWLNGGQEFLLSSEFVGPMPQRRKLGSLYLEQTQEESDTVVSAELDHELIYASWELVDESAGGLAIGNRTVKNQRTKVGDLVAVRSRDSGMWEINSVRWIKNPDSTAIEVGLQRISPVAHAVAVKTVSKEHQETDFLPALLIPELGALKQKRALLTHRGVFKLGRQLYFDDGYRLAKVRATKLVEATSSFEYFSFEEVGS